MKNLVLVFALLIFSSSLYARTLTVIIDGLKSNKGYIRVALFNSINADKFPSKTHYSVQKKAAKVVNERAQVIFESLPAGIYAVAAYQDKDNDGKLDRSTFGRPKEPYGYSNNPDRPRRGPVAFQKASFYIGSEYSKKIRVKVKK